MVSRTNKFRGRSRYHGRGKKAGRGAGKRGGRGNAGINKHRLMTRLKYMPGHWGMYGFNRHPSLRNVNVTINLRQTPLYGAALYGENETVISLINN